MTYRIVHESTPGGTTIKRWHGVKVGFIYHYQCFHQAMIIPWKVLVLFFIICSTPIFFREKKSHQKTLELVNIIVNVNVNVNIIDRFVHFF
jgi:hypothetical protein